MKTRLLSLLAFVAISVSAFAGNGNYSVKVKRASDGTMVTAVPERPAGQKNVINLTTPKMETVRVGFIGLGMRGDDAVVRYTFIPGVKIVAVCDFEPDRVAATQKMLASKNLPAAAEYSGSEDAWKQLCNRDDIDLVYICTDWVHHTQMGIYAMEHGKNVAIEVPAATSLEEAWSLINTSERTRKHCMMLENCVYDFFEMTTLNMAQKGLFGEVLHCEGSYLHNLDEYWGEYWHNWRLTFNKGHRGDVYPTHGIGPLCQILNIHRGDRIKTLVAMDTKAVNGPKHVKAMTGEECTDFQNGDETSTLMRTENGKTILIEHDVMTPRPYSRMFQVVGTDGYASKYPVEQYCFRPTQLDTKKADYQNLNMHEAVSDEVMQTLNKDYRSVILTPELEALAKKVGGHGGMDFIMDYRMIYCLHNGLPFDMDVYDLAEWCSVGELSRISIENGNAPVAVPDFTRGAWNRVKGFSYAF